MNYPDNNPKTLMGVQKVPLHLVPPSSTHYLALAFKDGAAKYGPYNWRDKTVSSSIYIGAVKRHIDAWFDGEEVSADAGVHHLAHAMACLAIILDAQSVEKLNDDRPTKGAASRLQQEFAAPTPKQLEFVFKEPEYYYERISPAVWHRYDQSPAATQVFERLKPLNILAEHHDSFGAPVREGYSGFLGPDSDPVVERRVPDVQENVRKKTSAGAHGILTDFPSTG